MIDRRVRFLRGWLTAGFSVVVAAFSHVAGGGAEPGLLGVGLAVAFAVPVCIALAGRRLSTARIALSVVLSQVAFHLLFSLGSAVPAGATATGGHHSPLIVSAAAAAGSSPAMHMAGPVMWLAHGVAALLTVVGLVRGHRVVASLLRIASRRAAVAGRLVERVVVLSPEARLPPPTASPGLRPAPLRFLRASPRRGPPLSV